MPKPTALQIQLTRFAADGTPRYIVTKTVQGRQCRKWKDCNAAVVNAIQTVFLENVARAADDTVRFSGVRALRGLDAFADNLAMREVYA